MPIPPLGPAGVLPEGRHQCTLDEVEEAFVDSPDFAGSATRKEIFGDFIAALGVLRKFDAGIIERAWIGGAFASGSVDPDDLDVTFVLNEKSYLSLSNRSRLKIMRVCKDEGFKKTMKLRVDGFAFVHEMIALPWVKAWISDAATPYLGSRGAWDDWWSRRRVHGAKGAPPVVADAELVRGYLEVIFDG